MERATRFCYAHDVGRWRPHPIANNRSGRWESDSDIASSGGTTPGPLTQADSHLQLIAATQLQKGDVAFRISCSSSPVRYVGTFHFASNLSFHHPGPSMHGPMPYVVLGILMVFSARE